MNSPEMPKYRCHKEVWALKIKSVEGCGEASGLSHGQYLLSFADVPYSSTIVTAEYVAKHNPQPGGYYVVYDDGYTSFSPAEAFEAGHTSVPSVPASGDQAKRERLEAEIQEQKRHSWGKRAAADAFRKQMDDAIDLAEYHEYKTSLAEESLRSLG